jgi:hypothetical protein
LGRLVARNEEHFDVLVELDVHGAHLALGIVDLVDALFFLFQAFIAAASELGEDCLDLLHLRRRD